MNYIINENKKKALYEISEIIKSYFTLTKNIIKLNSPSNLSSSAKIIIESDDMKDIKKGFEKFTNFIIESKKLHVDEFNLLITENQKLKDLMNIYRKLIDEINIKLTILNSEIIECNLIISFDYKIYNYKICDYKDFIEKLEKNINDKYKLEGSCSNIQRNKYESPKQKKIPKRNLNILFYDENINNEENSDICAFISLNIDGTFYGCHYFELFKIILEKIKNTKKNFILICSGSSSKKIFDYCSNISIINSYYIFCYNKKNIFL